MATERELARFLQPLLAGCKDLILVKRRVIVVPIRHFVRGVLLDRWSDPDSVRPCWFSWALATDLPLGIIGPGGWPKYPDDAWKTTTVDLRDSMCRGVRE